MKPAVFEYVVPQSVDEAVSALADEDAKALAGGQSLVPMLALRLARFERLVDLNRIPGLAGIREDNGSVVIGAMTRQGVIASDARVRAQVPMLTEATRLVGHFQIRTRGTIGGSLAHADPAAEYPAVALALGAEFAVAGRRGCRTIEADDFFDGPYTTTLEPEELLIEVRLPVRAPRTGTCIAEFARRHGDFAVAGIAAAVAVDAGGVITQARAATFGLSGRPQLLAGLDALAGRPPEEFAAVAMAATEHLDPPTDAQANSGYRLHLAPRLLTEAL